MLFGFLMELGGVDVVQTRCCGLSGSESGSKCSGVLEPIRNQAKS